MTLAIGVQATVELEDDATIESVKADFLAQIVLYLPVALSEGEVKYTRRRGDFVGHRRGERL